MEAPEKNPAPKSPLSASIRLGALALGQALALWLTTKLLPSIPCNTFIDGASCQSIAPLEQLMARALVALIFLPFAYFALHQIWQWKPESRAFLRWLLRLGSLVLFGYMVLIWGNCVVALLGRFLRG